jgi:hypothetical protein
MLVIATERPAIRGMRQFLGPITSDHFIMTDPFTFSLEAEFLIYLEVEALVHVNSLVVCNVHTVVVK